MKLNTETIGVQMMVKIYEVMGATQQAATVMPAAYQQQARVNKVMKDIAASDAKQQEPTEMDKVLAMRQMATRRKQADKEYALRMQQQATNAVTQAQTQAHNIRTKAATRQR